MKKVSAIILAALLMAAASAFSAPAVMAQSEPAKPEAPKAETPKTDVVKPVTTPATTQAPSNPPAAAAASAALPTVDQIVDKYVQALGGKEAVEKLTSTTAKGAFELPSMGVSGTAEVLAKAPNRRYQVVSIPSFGDIRQGYDGTTAWAQDPESGKINDLTGSELARASTLR